MYRPSQTPRLTLSSERIVARPGAAEATRRPLGRDLQRQNAGRPPRERLSAPALRLTE